MFVHTHRSPVKRWQPGVTHLPRFGRGQENKIDTQINEPDYELLVAKANVSFR